MDQRMVRQARIGRGSSGWAGRALVAAAAGLLTLWITATPAGASTILHTEAAARLKEADKYQDYLFLHGLGVEMTEALAEYWHWRIRREWGFAGEDGKLHDMLLRQHYRGGRYSWGYPACPDLEDNAKVAELLGADRIGVIVSEGFQLHPEQSTSAIICHHPQAKYFVAG